MTCSRGACFKRVQARGMCAAHYKAARVAGEFSPRAYSKERSGRRVGRNGYGYLWAPQHPLAHADGYVAEHRKVVYDAGIPVPAGWHVHHKNHDKSDNRLSNLEVLPAADHHRGHVAELVTNQYGTFPRRRA